MTTRTITNCQRVVDHSIKHYTLSQLVAVSQSVSAKRCPIKRYHTQGEDRKYSETCPWLWPRSAFLLALKVTLYAAGRRQKNALFHNHVPVVNLPRRPSEYAIVWVHPCPSSVVCSSRRRLASPTYFLSTAACRGTTTLESRPSELDSKRFVMYVLARRYSACCKVTCVRNALLACVS